MNCFVIMPFANEYDDVYHVVKNCVDTVLRSHAGTCFRLDESAPAGRITDRLIRELGTATLCVADLTGLRPNIMWEVGYAMALHKPVIVITQDAGELPFDIKDLQRIVYSRQHLMQSLSDKLKQALVDTIDSLDLTSDPTTSSESENQNDFVAELMKQVGELKGMVLNAVHLKSSAPQTHEVPEVYPNMQGAWVNPINDTHYYAKIIDGELIGAYCYCGNDHLTGVYYDWRRTGEYWFSRFKWIDTDSDVSGFAFIKHESIDLLTGAWWYNDDHSGNLDAPPKGRGVSTRWERHPELNLPRWANNFFDDVAETGLQKRLFRRM